MTAAISLNAPAVEKQSKRPQTVKAKMRPYFPQTEEEFWQWQPRDGYKYEWANGKLLKLHKMVSPSQYYIVDNIVSCFNETKSYQNGDRLMPETQSRTMARQTRVPDIAFFTKKQKSEMREKGIPVTPYFAIEIISKGNGGEEMFTKLEEYFDSGVEVIWYINPPTKTVFVFQSPEIFKICKGETMCSAERVIEGFSMSVNQIFAG